MKRPALLRALAQSPSKRTKRALRTVSNRAPHQATLASKIAAGRLAKPGQSVFARGNRNTMYQLMHRHFGKGNFSIYAWRGGYKVTRHA